MVSLANAALVGAVAALRLIELQIARRNATRVLAQGGVEHGRRHYPFMVALHVGLLAGSLFEPIAAARPFDAARFAAGVAVLAAANALRWWVMATLGWRWTTRVIVLPGSSLVGAGPFRYLKHPNYLAVVLEVAALPLAVGAWVTAAVCSLLDGILLLAVRIPCEEAALGIKGRTP